MVAHFRNLTLNRAVHHFLLSVMPKIRTSIISEHLRRRVKVLRTLPANPSFILPLSSVATFTKQYSNAPPTATSPNDPSLQKRRRTSHSRQPLLKPNVDRFNTRGRTIYNASDCFSSELQGYPSRLRLMHASHRRNTYDMRKASSLPEETRVAGPVDAGVTTRYHDAQSEGLFKPTNHADDADILQQADRLFEMYIRMD